MTLKCSKYGFSTCAPVVVTVSQSGERKKEEITGATIKDIRTKSRGRVEVGEGGGTDWGGVEVWGENADNCH